MVIWAFLVLTWRCYKSYAFPGIFLGFLQVLNFKNFKNWLTSKLLINHVKSMVFFHNFVSIILNTVFLGIQLTCICEGLSVSLIPFSFSHLNSHNSKSTLSPYSYGRWNILQSNKTSSYVIPDFFSLSTNSSSKNPFTH